MSVKNETKSQQDFPLSKSNYLFIAIGFAIILIGFALMSGGKSEDPSIFNPEVFSFRRITLAPVVVMVGFISIIYAIIRKPKD
ncbi:MAG: DUF3098 domain-containing protein [Bacteroidetes bacterium HGW-Bacteroidetes-21]|jgi:uncharacterized membrane protein|nr:MAG: DUF3098 domain-containing protein [Bacteroidetes bacterium HGW-Bacteroidetes-21]